MTKTLLLKRITCLVLALALVLPAQAVLALSPTLDGLEKSGGMSLTLDDIRLEKLNASSDEGFELLSGLLRPLKLQAALTGDSAYVDLTDGATAVFSGALGADLTEDMQKPLWHQTLQRVLDTDLPALFEAFMPAPLSAEAEAEEQTGTETEAQAETEAEDQTGTETEAQAEAEAQAETVRPEKRGATIRYVGRSTQRITLTVDQAALAAQQAALAPLYEDIGRLTAHLPYGQALTAWLDGAAVERPLTFIRLMDDAGATLGWQMSGRVKSGDDVRKLSFTGGYKGLNAYITLELSATRGSDRFRFTLELQDKEQKNKNQLTGSLTCQRKKDGESHTVKDTVKLKAETKDGEKLTGTVSRKVTADGTSTIWTVKPSLHAVDGALTGTLDLQKVWAQTTVWTAEARLSVGPAGDLPEGPALSRAQVIRSVGDWYLDKYNALSPEGKRQMAHMLRTDSWTNGAVTVAPADLPQPDGDAAQTVEPGEAAAGQSETGGDETGEAPAQP